MDNQQLIAEIRERHESDDAILLGHIEAECCDAHRESHNDRAELLRIAKELEEQLDAARRVVYGWKHGIVTPLDTRYWDTTNRHIEQIEEALKEVGDEAN